MIKKIKLKGSPLQIKIRTISSVCFEKISDSELQTLISLLEYEVAGCTTLTIEVAKQIRSTAGISDSNFNTSLFRLEKKGVIKRNGKTVMFHPVFNNVREFTGLLINFESADVQSENPKSENQNTGNALTD
jgi:hypothetical protein